jgi:hypothetical protein
VKPLNRDRFRKIVWTKNMIQNLFFNSSQRIDLSRNVAVLYMSSTLFFSKYFYVGLLSKLNFHVSQLHNEQNCKPRQIISSIFLIGIFHSAQYYMECILGCLILHTGKLTVQLVPHTHNDVGSLRTVGQSRFQQLHSGHSLFDTDSL